MDPHPRRRKHGHRPRSCQFGSGQCRPNAIHLFDPAARTQTLCTIATKECRVSDYHPRREFALQTPGPFANGTRSLSREDIGNETINGISVIGSRETTIINPGVVGNDKALATTREFWYAPSIRTNLLVTRVDPREGKQVIALTDLALAEPDSRMFEVPAGYTVVDERTENRLRK
jgi:hypothetical protein